MHQDLRDANSLDGSAAMSGADEGASAGANASYSISAAIETRLWKLHSLKQQHTLIWHVQH